MTLRVGLLDSGVAADLAGVIDGARRFWLEDAGTVLSGPTTPDVLGHGTALARIVLATAPTARLLDAQVFQARLVTAAAVVAAGLRWLVGEGARVVTLSLGLREDRPVLREACDAALEAGVVLLAAAPARGLAVYPAAYPGVLRVTGDARCGPGAISRLGTAQADYGACPRPPEPAADPPRVGGASFAVAYAAGVVAAHLATHPAAGPHAARLHLDAVARYHGPERRAARPAGGS